MNKRFGLKQGLFIGAVLIPILLILINLSVILNHVTDAKISNNNFFLEIDYKQLTEAEDLPINLIVQKLEGLASEPLNSTSGKFGLENRWHLLTLNNMGNKDLDLVILFDNPSLDVLEVYSGNDHEKLIFELNKYQEPIIESLAAMPRVQLNIGNDDGEVLLIKTQTDGSPNLPILIFHQEEFEQYKEAVYLLWGGFIAVVLLMSIYNLILYIGNRETLYLIYIAYTLLFLVVLSVVHGFGLFIFSPSVYEFVSQYLIFFYFWLGVALLAFTLYFLKFNSLRDTKINKLTRLCILILGLLSVITFFIPEYQAANFFFPVQSLIYVLCLVMLVSTFKQSSTWAKYYILSWFPLLVGSAIGTMLMIGQIEYTFWSRHATMLSVLFEMAFISMALAERVRISESQRLYDATHDDLFYLPNFSALKTQSVKYDNSGELANYSLILVKVRNFNYLKNTLSKDELVNVIISFTANIEFNLSQDLMILDTSSTKVKSKVYAVGEGLFACLISSNDLILMSGVLKQLPLRIAKSYPLESQQISIDYNIGVSANSESHKTIDSLFQQANLALENNADLSETCSFFTENMATEYKKELNRVSKAREILSSEKSIFELERVKQKDSEEYKLYDFKLRSQELGAIFDSLESLTVFCKNSTLLKELTEKLFTELSELISHYTSGQMANNKFIIPLSIDVTKDSEFLSLLTKSKLQVGLNSSQITLCFIDLPQWKVPLNILNTIKELKRLGFTIAIKLTELPSSSQQEVLKVYCQYMFIERVGETTSLLSVGNRDVINALTERLDLTLLTK